jgi:hypothetical protein
MEVTAVYSANRSKNINTIFGGKIQILNVKDTVAVLQ